MLQKQTVELRKWRLLFPDFYMNQETDFFVSSCEWASLNRERKELYL